MRKISIAFVTILLTGACTYDFPPTVEPTDGDLSLTKYVAIGGSATAGFMNGALYEGGQNSTYAKILAEQFSDFNNNAAFNSPIFTSPNGGFGGFVNPPTNTIPYGRFALKIDLACTANTPSPKPKVPGDPLTAFAGDKASLNNFGVVGLKLVEAANVPNYGTLNPFYGRFASNPAAKTVLADAAEKQATFFSIWLGDFDVVDYARNGASGNANGTNPGDMTPLAAFTPSITGAITAMLASSTDAKGVVANVPYFTKLPYFTTIGPRITPFQLDAGTATLLNDLYTAYGYSTPDGSPLFAAGNNYFIVSVGADADKKVRQFKPVTKVGDIEVGDYFVLTLPTDSLGQGALVNKCNVNYGQRAGWGLYDTNGSANPMLWTPFPIADKWVVDVDEVTAIKARTDEFNTAINTAITTANTGGKKVALMDLKALYNSLNTTINGSSITASLEPPFGAFALDGLFPNPRGQAFIANEFLRTINFTFGARIQYVNPNDYIGNELPVP